MRHALTLKQVGGHRIAVILGLRHLVLIQPLGVLLDLLLHGRLLLVPLLRELLGLQATKLLGDGRIQVVATRLLLAGTLIVIQPLSMPLPSEFDVLRLRHVARAPPPAAPKLICERLSSLT